MALTYFPVTGILKAAISDTSADVEGDPDIQFISASVNFKPSVTQVYSTTDDTIYRLQTIQARTDIADGVLKNIDGTAVSLVANTPELDVEELTYHVTFSNVTYDGGTQEIEPLRFTAPTDDTPVDLATVNRL